MNRKNQASGSLNKQKVRDNKIIFSEMIDKISIQELFNSFVGKRILVIGDIMVDSYLWGKVDRISPEAPVPVVALNKREYRLGGAANVALNIRNLGGIPILCSIIGDDEKGKVFLDLLDKQGLPSQGIISSKERITTVKFRIIGNNAQMLRVDEENQDNLSSEEHKALFSTIQQLIEKEHIHAIVFEDYDKGVITSQLIKKVVDLSKTKNIPVAVDPKKRNFWGYHEADLFKPNLKELKEGLKSDANLSDMVELRSAVSKLQNRLRSRIVMVTLSDRGLYYCISDEHGVREEALIPAIVRTIADVSGAGDTVIGTAVLCLAVNAPVKIMATLCNLAGGLVCEHVGVVPVDRELLMQEAIKHFGS
jgi:D-glycero-beta-D-manno-heptose-7-phosphate kinase